MLTPLHNKTLQYTSRELTQPKRPMDNMFQQGTRKGKLTEAKAYTMLYYDATKSRKSMKLKFLTNRKLAQRKTGVMLSPTC